MGRKHHTVPNFYLKRFADPAGNIHAVRRETDEILKMRSHKACRRTSFYTIEDDEGDRHEDVEEWLSEVESHAAAALARMIDDLHWPPNPEDREWLSVFMCLQVLRGPDSRAEQAQIADYLMKLKLAGSTTEGLRRQIRDSDPGITDEELEAQVAFIQDTDGYVLKPHPNQHIRSMLEGVPELTPMFFQRVWTVLHFDSPCMVTSDRPLLLVPDPDDPQHGVGLLTAAEIMFPLDRRRLLVMTHPPQIGGPDMPGDYIPGVPAAHGHAVAQRQALGAFEWWFKHPQDAHPFPNGTPPPMPLFEIAGPSPEVFRRGLEAAAAKREPDDPRVTE